jgi:hypothetical protein
MPFTVNVETLATFCVVEHLDTISGREMPTKPEAIQPKTSFLIDFPTAAALLS